MEIKELTGRWYLKKKLFGYIVMVEVLAYYSDDDFTNSPEFTYWRKATKQQLAELNINKIHKSK